MKHIFETLIGIPITAQAALLIAAWLTKSISTPENVWMVAGATTAIGMSALFLLPLAKRINVETDPRKVTGLSAIIQLFWMLVHHAAGLAILGIAIMMMITSPWAALVTILATIPTFWVASKSEKRPNKAFEANGST